MMRKICVFLSLICIIFYACSKTENKKAIEVRIPQKEAKPFLTKKEKQHKEREESEKRDSISMQGILNRAISKVKPHLTEKLYKTSYEEENDHLGIITVNISIGKFFSKKERHVLVHRSNFGVIHFNFFSINENELKEILHHEQWALTYVSDTIRDINGDQLKDFVINSYGSAGCCLKAASQVYLRKDDAKKFTDAFHFINPTFSPKEGIIRGICYGHPGETEMYKYKWNEATVDTLEFISFQRNLKGEKTGKFMRSNKRFHFKKNKGNQVLRKVPKEYEGIYGYDWFLGKI